MMKSTYAELSFVSLFQTYRPWTPRRGVLMIETRSKLIRAKFNKILNKIWHKASLKKLIQDRLRPIIGECRVILAK